MPPRRVSLGWAQYGPGTSDSAGPVRTSSAEPLADAELAKLGQEFFPGAAGAVPGRPGAAPWVTISHFNVAGQPYLGLAIQDLAWWPDNSQQTETSYFCVPYAASRPVTYGRLYERADSLRPTLAGRRDDDGLIEVTMPGLSPEALAGDVEHFGADLAGAIAALLLDGARVTIVGAESSQLSDRLRFIDAVAALLPYGYRAAYSAATWSDSDQPSAPIRLAFAERPRPGSTVVQWRSESAPRPAKPHAASYLESWQLFCAQSSGQDRLARLTRLISWLAGEDDAHLFGEPEHAAAALREFNLPFTVLYNGGDAAQLRSVFRQGRVDELPAVDRPGLLGKLIELGDQQDLELIGGWWGQILATEEPGAMLPAMIAACRRALWSRGHDDVLAYHVGQASKDKLLDPLLAGCVGLPLAPAERAGGLDRVADLLAGDVLPEGAGDFPQTRTALTASPLVACELLQKVAKSDLLPRALDWLRPDLRDLLAPYYVILESAGTEISPDHLARLAAYGPECILALLKTANMRARLDPLLPALAAWLVAAELARGEKLQHWDGLASTLNPVLTPSQAWLDLALLASGGKPRFVLPDIPPSTWRVYNWQLARNWHGLLASMGDTCDELLTDALVGYLEAHSWADDRKQAEVVVDLTTRLHRRGHDRLMNSVIRQLAASPEAATWEFARNWIEQERRLRPEVVRKGILRAIGQLRQGAPAAEIAGVCALAFRHAPTPEAVTEVIRTLSDSAAIASARVAADTLDELHRILYASPGEQGDPRIGLYYLASWFASGSFGFDLRDKFRDIVEHELDELIEYRRRIVKITHGNGTDLGDGLGYLSERSADEPPPGDADGEPRW